MVGSLMNILRMVGRGSGVLRQTPKPAGSTPGWAKRTFDPRKKQDGPVYTVPPGRTAGPQGTKLEMPGARRGTFYGDAPWARASRIALTGVGGYAGLNALAGMMRGDEADATAPVQARAGSYGPPPAPGATRQSDFETRQAFEARKNKKMNKQMFRLLQYYGMVNLINPDSASDMLKLGTAMLEQEIGQMGSDRQAKIFDAIFKDGKMPASGAEAAKMILNAGGTVEDVQDITGIYESITPKATSKPTKAEMQWELTNQIYAALQVGDMEQARQLAIRGIASKLLDVEGAHGMGLSLEDQATRLIEGLKGVASGTYNTSLAQGVSDIRPKG